MRDDFPRALLIATAYLPHHKKPCAARGFLGYHHCVTSRPPKVRVADFGQAAEIETRFSCACHVSQMSEMRIALHTQIPLSASRPVVVNKNHTDSGRFRTKKSHFFPRLCGKNTERTVHADKKTSRDPPPAAEQDPVNLISFIKYQSFFR
jgi:hypothetical protein